MQHDLTPIAQTINWTQQADDCVSQTQHRSAAWFLTHFKGLPFFEPSRAFGHYNARILAGRSVHRDEVVGARDMLNGMKEKGVCREELYRYEKNHLYDQRQWLFWNKAIQPPGAEAFKDGQRYRVTAYASLVDARTSDGQRYDVDQFRRALDFGHIFGAGIINYNKLSSRIGVLVVPPADTNPVHWPSHALTIIGYTADHLIGLNSYGAKWGPAGNGTVLIPLRGFADNPNYFYDAFVIQDMTG